MKKLLSILFLVALAMTSITTSVNAQKLINRNGDERFAKQYTTTDSTFTSVDSADINRNEAGIVEVIVMAVAADGKSVTGNLLYRYHSVSGTITLATADAQSAIVTDSGLSPATFKCISSGTKIYLQVKGKLSTTLYWYTILKRRSIYKP